MDFFLLRALKALVFLCVLLLLLPPPTISLTSTKRPVVPLHHISTTVWPETAEVKEESRTAGLTVKLELFRTCSSSSVSVSSEVTHLC